MKTTLITTDQNNQQEIRPPKVSNPMVMSFMSLAVTLPFALLNITQRKNKYFKVFGTLAIGAAMIAELDTIEMERKRLKLEENNN